MALNITTPWKSLILMIHILILSFVLALFPKDGLAESKFLIKPMISAKAEYDSNFYKTEDDERGVYTYIIEPGGMFEMNKNKSDLFLSYIMSARFYDDKSDVPEGETAADENNYVGHTVVLESNFFATKRLALGLHNNLMYSRVPTEYDKMSNKLGMEKNLANELTPRVKYEYNNKFATALSYTRGDIRYSETDINDTVENKWDFDLLYRPRKPITFDLDYQHWDREWPEVDGQSYTSDQAQLIFQREFRSITFLFGAGYQIRKYEAPNVDNEKDDDTITYEASITYPATIKKGDFLTADTHYYISAFRGLSQLTSYYETFIENSFTASVGHIFSELISAKLTGHYNASDYIRSDEEEGSHGKDRKDNTYDISLDIGWLISKYMKLSLVGGLEKRSSNLEGYDYDNTYIMIDFAFNEDFKSKGIFRNEASFYLR